MFTEMMFTSVGCTDILEGRGGWDGGGSRACGCRRGRWGEGGGSGLRSVLVHVFLEGAGIAEGIVPLVILPVEEAVEAFRRAVTGDCGVEFATVASIVGGLGVAHLATYTAPLVDFAALALVGVVGKVEALATLVVLGIGGRSVDCAVLPKHEAWGAEKVLQCVS